MHRVIFVNRVYAPDESATAQLLHDLATSLAARGFAVTVLTIRTAAAPKRERRDGVEIIRVSGLAPRGRSLLSRAFHYIGCWVNLVAASVREVRPGDAVVVLTDPPLIGIGITAALAGRAVKVCHWCQDVYPEVAMAVAGPGWRRRCLGFLRPFRDWSWRRAAACVTLGDDMRRLVVGRSISPSRVHVSPNWAPRGLAAADATALRRAWGAGDRLVVGYSGNLGRVHALTPMLACAAQLQSDPRVGFVIVGDGAQRAALTLMKRELRLENVAFQPAQPRARLGESLAAADLHVVALRPGCEGTVWPSKFYGIVAVGRPMLFIGPAEAEVSQLIVAHGLGASFRPEDVAGMAAFVRRLADEPAERTALAERVRQFARSLPGLEGAAGRWAELLPQPSPLAGPAE